MRAGIRYVGVAIFLTALSIEAANATPISALDSLLGTASSDLSLAPLAVSTATDESMTVLNIEVSSQNGMLAPVAAFSSLPLEPSLVSEPSAGTLLRTLGKPVASVSVPEPSSLLLLGVGGILVLVGFCQRDREKR